MDNKYIITTLISIIITGIIAPFFKAFFDKIFSQINPQYIELKNIFLKIILFTIRYFIPFIIIVFYTVSENPINKINLITLLLSFSAIIINLILDIIEKYIEHIIIDLNNKNKIVENILVIQKEHSKLFNKIIEGTDEINKSQLKLLDDIVNKLKKDEMT